MQKQKRNQNWSVKYLILRLGFSKISLFRMVLKRLKLHQFLLVWHERFPPQEFGNFSKKGCFRSFEWLETNFTTYVPPLERLLEKSTRAPPWKKSFRRPCTQKHVKLHHFCEKLCCITPSGNNVQQHQCSKQAIAGWQTSRGAFCQILRNPFKFTAMKVGV